MLTKHDAIATVAVTDMTAAQRFYEDVLGFTLVHDEAGTARTYRSGNAQLLVYRSEYAGTNQATAVTWDVGAGMDAIVAGLKRKGIVFQHYDLPGLKLEGDVHVADGFKAAWFKDPDGNILALVGR